MTVPDPYAETDIDYKQKYKALKKRLKLLVYEQECFLEELRKAQRKLLKVAKDRSFLLDRLMQYEKIDDTSGDSDATASSDSDAEDHHREGIPIKRKRVSAQGISTGHVQPSGSGEATQLGSPTSIANLILAQQQQQVAGQDGAKKRSKTPAKKPKTAGAKPLPEGGPVISLQALASPVPGQMTREELERHLDAKQNVFGIEKATASLPMDIFSNDNSNHASDPLGNGTGDEDEEDLVIDIPH